MSGFTRSIKTKAPWDRNLLRTNESNWTFLPLTEKRYRPVTCETICLRRWPFRSFLMITRYWRSRQMIDGLQLPIHIKRNVHRPGQPPDKLYLTLSYRRGGLVLATQRWGHNSIGQMRIPKQPQGRVNLFEALTNLIAVCSWIQRDSSDLKNEIQRWNIQPS